MKNFLVCPTFDHDNASSRISRKLTSPTMISRSDFRLVAVRCILALHRDHGDGGQMVGVVGRAAAIAEESIQNRGVLIGLG